MPNDIQVSEFKQITAEEAAAILSNNAEKVKAVNEAKTEVVNSENTVTPESEQVNTVEAKQEVPSKEGQPENQVKPKRPRRIKDRFSFSASQENTENKTESVNPGIEELRKKLESIENDPAVKLVLEAKKSGKNLIQALNELRGTSVSAMNDNDIFRQYCRDNGITEEEEIEDELDKFNSQSRLVKKEQIEKIKSAYLAEEENRFGQFFNTKPDPKEAQVIEKFQNEVVSQLKNLNEYGGIKIDDSIRKSIINDLSENGFVPRRSDGTIDSEKVIKMMLWSRYEDMIIETLEKEFESIGVEKVFNEVEATPAALVHNKPPDFAKKAVTAEEMAEQASKSLKFMPA